MNIIIVIKKRIWQPIFVLGILLNTFSLQVKSQDQADTTSGLFNMSIEELMDTEVKIATKSVQKMSETPSIVSVFTAEDIKNMGARELADILRMVPGFEVTRNEYFSYEVGIRGVKNPRVVTKLLILVDGIPNNHIFYGGGMQFGFDLNMDAIKRIEIIRGPGSALYGRNAFSGVVNIIMKDGKDQKGGKLSGTIGNYDSYFLNSPISFDASYAYNASYAYSKKKLNTYFAFKKITLSESYPKYNDGTIPNIKNDNLMFNGKINYSDFTASVQLAKLYSEGGIGVNNNFGQDYGYYSLLYSKIFYNKIKFRGLIYGHNESRYEDWEQLKPGLSPIFENGLYIRPSWKEYLIGYEIEVNTDLFDNNNLLIGIQEDIHSVTDVVIHSNFDFITQAPFDNVGRSNLQKFEPGWFENNGHSYTNFAVYLQDMWYINELFGITFGGRYDYDSQIGSIINPRIGVVSKPILNTSVKILYGRAYRAPAPSEQYQTLGFAVGNPNLKPEIINSLELAISYKYKFGYSQISFYKNKLKDMIYAKVLTEVDPNNMYENLGYNKSTGFELESKIFANNFFSCFFNYSYTYSKNTATIYHSDTIDADNDFIVYSKSDSTFNHEGISPHMINIGVNYRFLKYFNANITAFFRNESDFITESNKLSDIFSKHEGESYAIMNTNLRIFNLIKNLESNISIYNILNQKYFENNIRNPNLIAQSGRHINLSFTYNF